MRILGLHLRAYGHFTGYSLDLGAEPGLHLIYGHNEAGKSTTLRAISSVLFGYPHDVVDGFKHDAKDIAVGIDLLAADGRRLSFVRRRRGKHALTAADGSALDDAVIRGFLGGVSRDVFEKVFALDHQRLRQHARALLADGGSLGFSLAEAGSGIAGLKAVLDRLKTERAALFLAGGSKPRLNQAIAQVIDLRREARRSTVSPADYRAREKRIQEVDAEIQRMRGQRRSIESDIIRLQRIEKNLPLRAEYRALTLRIESLEDVPMLPPEFVQRRIKAEADLDAAQEDISLTSAAIEELERRIAAISLDAAVLGQSREIEKLAKRCPVIEDYETDIPKREAERAQLHAAVKDLIAKAELEGGQNLATSLPSALKRKAILALADSGNKLVAQSATARDTVEAASRALDRARDRAARTPEPLPTSELSGALTAADKLGDITAEIAKRTRALERRTKALHETIIGLGLGTDRISALREFVVPPEKAVARFAELLADTDAEMKATRDTLKRLDGEIAEIDRSIAVLKTAGDVATEDDLSAARQARDQGWALIRGLYIDGRSGLEERAQRFAPDGRIAAAYEQRVRDADSSADVMRAHLKESTELAMLRRRKADLEAKGAAAKAAVKALGAQRDKVLSDWRSLWPAGFITVQLPGEMTEWLTRRASALAEADDLEAERDSIAQLVGKERDAQRGLAAAMAAFGDGPHDCGLDSLRDRARRVIRDAADAKTRYEKAEEAVRGELARKLDAEEAAGKLQSRIDDWKATWRAALVEAGLPPGLTIEMASATLRIIDEIDVVKSRIDELTHRIEAMGHDRDAFRDAIAGVTAALPGTLAAGNATLACRSLEERLRAARSAEVEIKNLADQLKIQANARDRADAKLRRSRAALDMLCIQAGCASADELAEIERKSAEKQDALSARAKLETGVREGGGGRDLAELFEECDDIPGDRISADLIGLKADREETEAQIEKLMSARAALQADFESLLGQNQAADFMQEAATVEAEIAEMAEAYVDLAVQETLLRAAIDIYRDRHQGPILMRAKDLFAELTDGAYVGLRADVNERGETILIAEDAIRGSLEIDALSDGTIDSLYLALRLAVVQEHNATREPLPFVADDLLLNLDNSRAQAALRSLAATAVSSQVLLFTHHAHMVDLARHAVPPRLLVEHHLYPAIRAARAAE